MVIADVGTALGAAGSSTTQNPVGEAIFDAWTSFAQNIYDEVINSLPA